MIVHRLAWNQKSKLHLCFVEAIPHTFLVCVLVSVRVGRKACLGLARKLVCAMRVVRCVYLDGPIFGPVSLPIAHSMDVAYQSLCNAGGMLPPARGGAAQHRRAGDRFAGGIGASLRVS
jgi:hypothetical protein